MTRRRNVRRPRRVQVQFWRRGEAQAYTGYSTNISTTGMFLATTSPQGPGTRLRVEVMDGNHGFVVEGVVAHARKVRGDMMRLTHPGMGIRFLSVEELVRELIPVLPGETEEIPEAERLWGPAGPPETAASPPPEPVPPPLPLSPSPPLPPLPPSPPPPAPQPQTTTAAMPPPARPSEPATRPVPVDGIGVFNVQFLGPSEFLEVFQRDILNGGLFVSTRYPGRLQETIKVDLLPPVPFAEPVSFRARVVQRFEPHGNDFGPNLLAGMGVEILDLAAVLERLRPLVERLKLL
jgi:PilZ domain